MKELQEQIEFRIKILQEEPSDVNIEIISELTLINKRLKQLMLATLVGSSTFKVSISDSYCTYDFEMELPKTTCIRDISKRLYASFGLKEEQGKLRK